MNLALPKFVVDIHYFKVSIFIHLLILCNSPCRHELNEFYMLLGPPCF